jgi:serine/threonine protein kinase
MNANLQREEALFHEAVQLADPAQRKLFLDRACAGDPALRAGVEELLAAHALEEQFFGGEGSALSWSGGHLRSSAPSNEDSSGKLPAEEQPGTKIGCYKLLQKIGEGGCGVVYMVEQAEPVRRRVALKIIKLGMDTKNVIARFEAERQALALMEHPNIARVFDAGATETGRPYFVMELVHGVKLTEYCDQHHLDTRQRLDLFVQICHAIQHAHQKGVIHRDIKPSNILVTLHDGVPVPKVIDFGIAKATAEQLTDKTLFTGYGNFIGTPAYISPEQAEMSGLDVDTRSDIYSLGVLLYELLTGKTPFDGKQLLQSGFFEMRRTLCETDPQRPSTMVAALDDSELTVTAERRHADPPKLISQLRGDLDWIVMKALEKDRRRRYETANALALDVQRYLNNEPILARPPSRWYRFQKLVSRNKIVFAAGASVAVALIIGLSVSTWLFFKEREAERQQTLLRQEAERTSARETELRRQAELREKITQASLAISQDRMEDADQAITQVSNVPPSLESAAVLRRLGEWYALNGRWQQASERFATLVNVNRFDGWDVAASDALECAAAMAESGNLDAYDRFREAMVDRFAASPHQTASDRIVKAALMLPASDSLLQTLKPVIETTTSKIPPTIRTQPPAEMLNVAAAAESGSNARPTLVDISSFDGRSIGVDFGEVVESTSATNIANYLVPGTAVTNVTLGANRESVTLWLASPLHGQFTVRVGNVKGSSDDRIFPAETITNSVLNLRWWVSGDATNQPCSVAYSGNTAAIVAGGSDIWLGGDNFVFQYRMETNDFDYRLRVQSVVDTDGTGFARTGLMVRDSLTDINGHMMMVEKNAGPNAGNKHEDSFEVTLRLIAGHPESTFGAPPNPLPAAYGSNSWLRLCRSGTKFAAYSSSNGMNWAKLRECDGASDGDKMFTNSVLFFGIATSAHSRDTTTKAVVSELGGAPVKIIAQPAAVVAWRQGAPGAVNLVAAGSLVSYQWRMNGADIPGATNATYNVAAAQPSDAGIYSVIAGNNLNTLISSNISVIVVKDTNPPVITDIVSYDGLSVVVKYDKLMDPTTTTNSANYRVNDAPVVAAGLVPGNRSVVLRLGQLVDGQATVTVNNVKDSFSNIIIPGTKATGPVLTLQLLVLGDAFLQPYSVAYSGDQASIIAGGSDIIGDSDNLVYQYLVVTNDFDFHLRVQSVSGGGGAFARSGLMARDSVRDTSSHQVMVAVNAENTFQVIVRTVKGSVQTQSQPPNPLPASFGSNSWVRLQRVGTIFRAYHGNNGVDWTPLYQFDSAADVDGPFANPIYLGIATSSWSAKMTAKAEVSDFGVTQTTPVGATISLALIEYRRKNYAQAMEWCHRCLTYPDYQAARIATARAILAMCCFRLNQTAEARSELARSRDIIQTKFTAGLNSGNANYGFWFDWVSAHVLLREATDLIRNTR